MGSEEDKVGTRPNVAVREMLREGSNLSVVEHDATEVIKAEERDAAAEPEKAYKESQCAGGVEAMKFRVEERIDQHKH